MTSSLTHAQSNGKAESAVTTVKRLFTKCQESGHSDYLALLDWRNSPSQGIGTGPAQRLMERVTKTPIIYIFVMVFVSLHVDI